MILLSLTIVAPPERCEEILEVLRSLIGPTQVQTGCLSCRVVQDVLDRDLLTFLEEWQTEEDLKHRIRSDHFRKLLAVMELSARRPELRFHTVTESSGIEYVAAVRGLNAM